MQFEQIPDFQDLFGRIVHEWSPMLSHAALRVVMTLTYYGYVGNRGLEWSDAESLASIIQATEGYTRRMLAGLATLGILQCFSIDGQRAYSVNRSWKPSGHARMQRQFVRYRGAGPV